MLISYKRGQGSIVLRVKILNSSVTTGAGLTGLTFNSAGLIIAAIADNEAATTAYAQAAGKIEDIAALGAYVAPTATKCRFKELDSTNHKGVYEIQIADARFAVASAKSLLVSISGASNCAETDALIPLTDVDPYDGVRHGMTALPAAVPGAAGGVFIAGTNAAVTITSAGGTALTVSSTGSNGHGMSVTGHGGGEGILATGGGTSGTGIQGVGGATNGKGIVGTGTGTGEGLYCKGGNDGASGLKALGGTTNSIGIEAQGVGTHEGFRATGGTSSGIGIQGVGGTPNGIGMHIDGSGTGTGLKIDGSSHGVEITATAGPGIEIDGTTFGIECDASAGPAIHAGGTTFGIQATASNGAGMQASGTTFGFQITASAGPGLSCVASAGDNSGIVAAKSGAGYDIDADIHGTIDTTSTVTNRVTADMTYIHGTALTESPGMLAARFSDFFDQASAVFSVATALASFKATGFATAGALATHDTEIKALDPPTEAEMNLRTLPTAQYGTAANQATIATYIDTEIGTLLARLSAARAGYLDELAAANLPAGVAAVAAVTNALTAAAAAKLALSAAGIVTGKAQTGTLSTTQMTTDLAEVTNDHYIGRVIVWTSGALNGQASDITDYVGAGGLLTFTAVTDIPANNDTFVIL